MSIVAIGAALIQPSIQRAANAKRALWEYQESLPPEAFASDGLRTQYFRDLIESDAATRQYLQNGWGEHFYLNQVVEQTNTRMEYTVLSGIDKGLTTIQVADAGVNLVGMSGAAAATYLAQRSRLSNTFTGSGANFTFGFVDDLSRPTGAFAFLD